MRPALASRYRASWSSTRGRAVLMIVAPSFISLKCFSVIIPSVSGVVGVWMVM